MNMIAHAEKALLRNWRAVAFYLLCSIGAFAFFYICQQQLEALAPGEKLPKPMWFVTASLLLDLSLAAGIAALQAIVFARIGAEIDRPLWKYTGSADALRRFFVLWFIIALIFFAISYLQASASHQGLEHAVAALELPRLLWVCVSLPIGVCIMYGGELKWEEVPDRLSPILHLLPKAMIAFMLGLLQYILIDLGYVLLPDGYRGLVAVRVLINVPLVLLECLAFAVTWFVCMEYRDTAVENDDNFDF